MAIYGRGASGADGDFYLAGGSEYSQKATVMGAMPENGWGYRFGGRFARWYLSSGTSSVTISAWDGSANSPGELLASSAVLAVTNAGSYAGEGTLQSAAVASTTQPESPTETGFAMRQGVVYALGVSVGGAQLLGQMIQAQNSPYSNKYFYNRDSSSPSNPFGSVFSSYEGNMTLYVEYEPNTAPSTPTAASPSGTIIDTTPDFTSTFVDGNTDRGDRLTKYQIQIMRNDTGAVIYDNTFDAGASETINQSWTYNGAALPQGVSLAWRIRHADFFTAWSAFSGWTNFQLNPGGSVAYSGPSTANAKLFDPSPDAGSFTYSHIASLAGTALQVQLVNASGSVVRGPTQITRAIAVGSSQAVTWANILAVSAWADLSRGVSYAFEFRVIDSGGVWSPWARGNFFTINQLPNVPTGVGPSGGVASTTAPLIYAKATDPDDSPTGDLDVQFSIRNAASTYSATPFGVWNAANQRFEYQPASLANDTYYVKARSLDALEVSAYSAESQFIVAPGPSLTITAPTNGAVVATNRPVLTWTTTSPKNFRVRLYDVATGLEIADSGVVVSASTSQTWTPNAGPILEGMQIRADILVTDTNNLTNTGSVTFSVDYPEIAAVPGFHLSPYIVEGDRDPTAIQISWLPEPSDDPSKFVEYVVLRESASAANPYARVGVDEEVVIVARNTSFMDTMAIDYFPASGRTYTYTVYRVMLQGTEFKPSLSVAGTMTVEFRDSIFASATRGGDLRAVLNLATDTTIDPKDDATFMIPWGEAEPTAFVGTTDYDTARLRFSLTNLNGADPDRSLAELESLRARRETVCYRDARGYKVFGYISMVTDYRPLGMYEADIRLIGLNFPEGY